MKNPYFPLFIVMLFMATGCFSEPEKATLIPDREIKYCSLQAGITLKDQPAADSLPHAMERTDTRWQYTHPGSWTSGFWPGILWYLYEATGDPDWETHAWYSSETLLPVTCKKARSHDIGFITMCSLGNGYRLTGDTIYREALLRAAHSLTALYNPVVGTILSWPGMVAAEGWPHNTIIDNMMNLELLLWASKNGGGEELYQIAVSHADCTMENGFRDDLTSYHVAVYDTITGDFIRGVTHQGLYDHSMWARGQAWGIYGYTFMYRETGEERYLDFASRITDTYLSELPQDLVPYWDFMAVSVPDKAFRDASAAAITASALLELSTYIKDQERSSSYRKSAEQMLASLSSEAYQARSEKSAFLLHSVGHMPKEREVDGSIIYADYYYLEALIRLKRLQEGKPVI
ncbi:MAG: glycoside hydrolase family 88 protein [Bacteroides sp.]|nr:glycoside hydrolase family 88 protein [Bacteroides sp.]